MEKHPILSCLADQSTGTQLCSILRTHSNHRFEVVALSLISQEKTKLPRPKLFLLDTTHSETWKANFSTRVSHFNAEYCPDAACLEYWEPPPPTISPTSYGFEETDWAIDRLVDEGEQWHCDFLLTTNGDNVYSSYLLHYVERYTPTHSLIAWHFTSHHEKPSPHVTLRTELRLYKIDLGAFIASLAVIREHQLRFLKFAPDGRIDWCDGRFVEEFIKVSMNHVVIPKLLFLHQ